MYKKRKRMKEEGAGGGEMVEKESMSTSPERLLPDDEKLALRDLMVAAEPLTKEGDAFYLISQRWWKDWLEYVSQNQTTNGNDGLSSEHRDAVSSTSLKRPSSINNYDLICEPAADDSTTGIELRDTLVEGTDYLLLPKEVWNQLYTWQVPSKGTPMNLGLFLYVPGVSSTGRVSRFLILEKVEIWKHGCGVTTLAPSLCYMDKGHDMDTKLFDCLDTLYGGGPTLARKVIHSGLSQTELSVEVYPLRLQLHLIPKGEQSAIRISKKETVGELHRKACEIFDLKSEQVCIWDYFSHQKHVLMNNMDKTLDDVNIQMDQDILVEVTSDTGGCMSSIQENGSTVNELTVFVDPSKSSLSVTGGLSRNGNSENSHNPYQIPPAREVDKAHGITGVSTRGSSGGLTGLLNLGNTCFMNSAVQCLVHTPEFARYFREDYHQEINWHNPLGMDGELAVSFGELLRKLWAPGRNPVAPRPFKAKVSRFAPQFNGNNQHDSQELLAFLLDGLHEDLNRVKHKPYIKSRDAEGRTDEEVADEYWSNHIARNDSIIVDVCQGQYKSTVVCPVCNKISVTFDPFMYLSLPLQSTTTRTMVVTVFTCDGSALPAACTITVPKQGRCRDLTQALSSACSLKHNEMLLLAEIQNHFINRFLDDPLMPLSSIKDEDHLAAYKIPKTVKSSRFLQLINRQEELEAGNVKGKTEWKPYGTPLVAPISCDGVVRRGDIHSIVHTILSPMLRSDNLDHPDASDANTSSTALHPTPDVNCTEASSESNLADSNQSKSGISKMTTLHEFPIQMLDENDVCNDVSAGDEEAIKVSSSSSVLVFFNWSQEFLDKYDTTYLENLPEVLKNGSTSKKARAEPLSLYTCLEAFLREEPLVPEDMWYCPRCKERRQASKKLDLWRLPEVLVIHLKRFSYNRLTKQKLETFVKFPIHDFDVTNYVANKRNSSRHLYELYALTNHYGGMGSGHYTAHIKLLDENRWYSFDDNHVSPITEEDVKSGAAYVLFYRRVKTNHSTTASNGAQSCAGHNNFFLSQIGPSRKYSSQREEL